MTDTAPARPGGPGRSADITARQDQPEHLRRLLAYSRHYIVGQRWRRVRMLGTAALAIVAPWVALTVPSTTDVLAAIAAGWLVLGRTLLTWLEAHAVDAAVRTQELYDTRLFHLPWNSALAGTEPAPEDVAAAAQHVRKTDRYLNWFSVDLGDTPWPGDVLLCQRQSMVWSRRDHRAYSVALGIIGGVVLVGGVIAAVVLDQTLTEYLIKIFLPTSPALLDTSELAVAHWRHADAREHAERDVQALWRRHRRNLRDVPIEDCRRIQDAAFVLRRSAPRVPALFYRVRRHESNEVTVAGAAALLSDDSA
jgi:hypothetical protein